MSFIISAFTHVITWDWTYGFYAALFIGACARLVWKILEVRR